MTKFDKNKKIVDFFVDNHFWASLKSSSTVSILAPDLSNFPLRIRQFSSLKEVWNPSIKDPNGALAQCDFNKLMLLFAFYAS